MAMSFGQMLRDLRAKKGVTLRELGLNSDIDVAYLSRIERETLQPPQKESLLDKIIEGLGASTDEGQRLKDQAAIDNEKFPKDIAEGVRKIVGIPTLLRSVTNKKLTAEQIKKITEFINENY